jgi:hypothetical protein
MGNTKPIQIDTEYHLALKLMTTEPSEKRDMKNVIQDTLDSDSVFKQFLSKARRKLREVTK